MTDSICPDCGTSIPSNAPGGLCPKCLLGGILEQNDDLKTEPANPDQQWPIEKVRADFPGFEILELVGIGGIGRVYKARDPRVDRLVAIKLLSPERTDDPEWVERFTREAKALARLNHANVVQIHSFGIEPMPHLVMEYVDGVNLRQAMAAGTLSINEALVIIPRLCEALHYAHGRGVMHRDIKPENILIDTEGEVKLVDFGLAKLRDEGALPFTLTQSGAKLGTIAYMAPEQIEKPSEVDHRADLFSLGVVFYEMLTGELPLGRFPSPSEANGTDPRLDQVVLRTLEKRRDKRFQDAETMGSEIESAASTSPKYVSTPTRPDYEVIEYKSRAQIAGWPLLHIAYGNDPQTGKALRARGIIAMGNFATGAIAMGIFARGIVSWGVMSVGLLSGGVLSLGLIISFGVLAAALLASHGVFALSTYSLGVTAIGYLAAGVEAIGVHTADLRGAVDPKAAEFGDRWLAPASKWSNRLSGLALFTMLIIPAVVALGRKNIRSAALYGLLSLIGIYTIFSTSLAGPSEPRFASKLKAQQSKIQKQKLGANADKAREWITEASRTDDLEAKKRAIDEVFAAIQSDDLGQNWAGVQAFLGLSKIKMERARFTQPLRKLFYKDTLDWEIRSYVVSALFSTDYNQKDIDTVLSLIDTVPEEVLHSLANAIKKVCNQDFTGEYAEPILSLLHRGYEVARQRESPGSSMPNRYLLGVFWGAKVTPEIESLLIDWTRLDEPFTTNGRGYYAFYSALSVIRNKSTQGVERLLELASNPDTNNIGGRCLWGIRSSVPDKQDQSKVATEVITLLGNRNDDYMWWRGIEVLNQYAGPEHRTKLQELADRQAPTDPKKEELHAIIKSLPRFLGIEGRVGPIPPEP